MNPALLLQAVSLAAEVASAISATYADAKTAKTVGQVADTVKGLSGSVDALTKVTALVNKAIAEGRDLTEAELDGLRAESEAALADWHKAGLKEVTGDGTGTALPPVHPPCLRRSRCDNDCGPDCGYYEPACTQRVTCEAICTDDCNSYSPVKVSER